MRITRVETIPVRLPIPSSPYTTENAGSRVDWGGRRSRISPKRPKPCLDYLLVRIETDEGLSGIGEAQADIGFFGNTLEELQASVGDYLGPQLVGKDATGREALRDLIDYRGNTCARSAIDMALHDLVATAAGISISGVPGAARGRRDDRAHLPAGRWHSVGD